MENARKQSIWRQKALAEHDLRNVKEVIMWVGPIKKASRKRV